MSNCQISLVCYRWCWTNFFSNFLCFSSFTSSVPITRKYVLGQKLIIRWTFQWWAKVFLLSRILQLISPWASMKKRLFIIIAHSFSRVDVNLFPTIRINEDVKGREIGREKITELLTSFIKSRFTPSLLHFLLLRPFISWAH